MTNVALHAQASTQRKKKKTKKRQTLHCMLISSLISKCAAQYVLTIDSPTPFAGRHPRRSIVSRHFSSWRCRRRWRRRPPVRAPWTRARRRPGGTFRFDWAARCVRSFIDPARVPRSRWAFGLSARFLCDFPIAPYHASPPRNTNEENAPVAAARMPYVLRAGPCLDDEFSLMILEKYRPGMHWYSSETFRAFVGEGRAASFIKDVGVAGARNFCAAPGSRWGYAREFVRSSFIQCIGIVWFGRYSGGKLMDCK